MDVVVKLEPPVQSSWLDVCRLLSAHPTRWGSMSWVSARSLVDSVNHLLSLGSDGLIEQLRQEWVNRNARDAVVGVADTIAVPGEPSTATINPDAYGDLRIIDRSQYSRFLIVGDPGEQDPSQYIVSPVLSAASRPRATADGSVLECGFVLLMSDVIYPAGDVDDYEDGLYRPYRTMPGREEELTNFLIEPPLIGLPGNHDWYDGLAGFMYHFCGQDRLGTEAYAPGWSWRSILYGRLFRILWRRPAEPRSSTTRWRTDLRPTGGVRSRAGDDITQPGPYYAVLTRDVLLVCVDTGISGCIDEPQYQWLERVSNLPGPKILVTGKPLVVNARLEPCWVGRKPRRAQRDDARSVWRLVNHPENGYIATLGGDTHNFQQYPGRDSLGPQVHLVSGGGGAFTHATHPYSTADLDPRVKENKDRNGYPPRPIRSFPSEPESLAFFVNMLVPSVVRTMAFLGLFVLGAVLVALVARVGSGSGGTGPALQAVGRAGDLALAVLLVLVLVRALRHRWPREHFGVRIMTGIGVLMLGVVAGSLVYHLDPAHAGQYLLWWLLITAYHCMIAVLLRRSAWWRPAAESRRPISTPVFLVGLVMLAVVTMALVVGAEQWRGSPAATVAAVLILACGLLGWGVRMRPGAARIWRRAGPVLAPVVQLAVVAVVLSALTGVDDRRWLVEGAAIGLGVVGGVVVATAVSLVLITEGLALLLTFVACRCYGRPTSYRRGWGWSRAVTHWIGIPVLFVWTIAWMRYWADSRAERAAAGLPLLLFSLVGLLLLVGWLRHKLRSGYLLITVPLLVAVLAAYLAERLGLSAPLTSTFRAVRNLLAAGGVEWVPDAIAGTAVVAGALLVSIALGHLAFLNAHLLLVPPTQLFGISMKLEDAERFIAARREDSAKRPADLSRRQWLYGRLTWPNLDEPGGPLQGKVSEIYSSDNPPFHKNFLEISTSTDRAEIRVHTIGGLSAGESPA